MYVYLSCQCTASNIDIIIGGAIGGVALIVVATVILIIIVAVRATSRHKSQSFNVRDRHGELFNSSPLLDLMLACTVL